MAQKKKAVGVALTMMIIIGTSMFYLTQDQYQTANYCYATNELHIGKITTSCSSGWVNLEMLCGKFKAGSIARIKISSWTCYTDKTCKPAMCEVSL